MDLVIDAFDNFLKTNFGGLTGSGRKNPAGGLIASHDRKNLNSVQESSGKLMRINHSGEVAAQGLYQGQLFFETDPGMRDYLERLLGKRLTILCGLRNI